MDTTTKGAARGGAWPVMWVLALGVALVLGACGGAETDGQGPAESDLAAQPASLVLFAASDGESGWELWRSDGTEAGTRMVRDISPGPDDGVPSAAGRIEQATLNGQTYFQAWDGVSGVELWRTDGTEAGTVRVADIADAPDSTASSFPDAFVVYEGAVYFAAENLAAGRELWRTDGTEAGTVRVADIRGGGNGDPRGLAVAGGRLWFTADDGLAGRELWSSDGTPAGTARVADLNTGGDGASMAPRIVPVGSGVVFLGNEGPTNTEPAYSDGTPGNTHIIADIWSGGGTSYADEFVTLGDRVVFRASDGGAAFGDELWVTNGTTATAIDIWPGTASSFPYGLTVLDGAVYFAAGDSTTGVELWRSDGTAAGTVRLENLAAGTTSSYPTGLTAVGTHLYFFATVGGVDALWRTDGSVGGAEKVTDLPNPGYCMQPLGSAGGRLLFAIDADGDFDGELWVSDGTAAGTRQLADVAVFFCGG